MCTPTETYKTQEWGKVPNVCKYHDTVQETQSQVS